MTTSSDAVATTVTWKDNLTVELKEKLYESMLGVFQDQVPDFARNPEMDERLLRTIRSWAEKFLNEVSDQNDYVEKVSRQICLLFAKVEVSLLPMALAQAAKTKEEQAQIMASNAKSSHLTDSLQSMMHDMKLKGKSESSEQGGTSQQSGSPHQFSASQPEIVVLQHTGEASSREGVIRMPMKYVQEILDDDARYVTRYATNIEKWRLQFAKHEVQYLRYHLPSLVFAFVDLTLQSLLFQEILQVHDEEDDHFASRVRICIKQIVTPRQFLPDGFDENCLEYLKLEIHHLIEKHKRLSIRSFESHRRLSKQR